MTRKNKASKIEENIQDSLKSVGGCVEVQLLKDVVVAEEINETRELFDKGRYGEKQDNKTFLYSMHEALYLIERGKFKIVNKRGKALEYKEFLRYALKTEGNFWAQYCVYKDLRKRGYIVKTALKFGADFRVYDRGVKPGEDHAKWVVYPVSESEKFTWFDFSAKNRVAHSTKKSLLLGVVDAEGEVTYYNVHWLRP